MAVSHTAPRRVALIGYDGAHSLDIAGPLEVFSMANSFSGAAHFELYLASPKGGEIVTSSIIRLAGSVPLAELPAPIDTVLISGGDTPGLRAMQDPPILDWLRTRARTTRRMGSVCSGAFILAATGLLDGRRATTHWGVCDAMREFRPQVILEPDAIFVADPPFYSSAGITAGIDLSLSMVEADCGPDVALGVARALVLFMRRPGGQTQFSAAQAVQAAATPKLQRLVAEVSENPTGALDVPTLADRAGMTVRTFTRLFHKETGVTPAAFVETARMNRAKALLETSDWPLARVADRSGFGSLDTLHRTFTKRAGVTPRDYRQRFGRAVAT